jgi:amino acid adenylation domain-containing protein
MDNGAQDRMTQNLHHGFLEAAARHPGNLALTVGKHALRYAELDETAQRWAAALLDRLERQPQRVGILAYRSPVSYIGVLATLMAGATFVPLNPNFPVERTRAMIALAELDALFVDASSLRQAGAVLDGLPARPLQLLPETEGDAAAGLGARVLDRAALASAPPLASPIMVAPDAHAYLLFTSGSTGQPKGVPVTHANVTSFLRTNQARYRLTPEDRLSQTFDQTFDLSIFDLFMAWNAGACLCSIPAIQLLSPFKFIREQGVTVWFSVPAVATGLRAANLLKPDTMPTLRWSLFCGEALPLESARAWQAAAPDSVVENLYGPTELTIACAVYRWHPERSPGECVNEIVPIGEVYEGLHAVVVDEELRPVPDGQEGELCVAGPQTFPGYWRDPDGTAACMFMHPGPDGQALRHYRTGDRVRRLPGGALAYLGRLDHQVKVNGYRVELSEIEAVLCRQPGVVSAVALGWPFEEGSARGLVAFACGAGLAPDALLAAVRQSLPAYMVPRRIHVVDAMPLNSNGKIDRKELRRRLAAGEVEG